VLLRLESDSELRARAGAQNRQRIREHYDALRMCEETTALLARL
jgi:hypothetical protein